MRLHDQRLKSRVRKGAQLDRRLYDDAACWGPVSLGTFLVWLVLMNGGCAFDVC